MKVTNWGVKELVYSDYKNYSGGESSGVCRKIKVEKLKSWITKFGM
ncbi:hypothetical protein [Fictibacillus arsenicus]|nr:hypothetical protein [Fictibacillus arsenicus]